MIPMRKIYGGAIPSSTSTSSSYIDTTSSSPLNTIPPVIVGIAGGSGSGKSTLTQAIIKQLGEEFVTYISYDSYYKDISHLSIEERAATNFDHPESLDTELLKAHIKELKLGKSVNVPEYCYKTHSRLNTYIPTDSRRIVIIDGILLFHDPELCSILDMKIFVDAEDDVRLIRRLRRDTTERARSVESVLDQYSQTVKPMHYLFVEPSKKHADIIIPTNQGIQAVALEMCISRLREIINYYQ
jgi:uridine kinase